MVEIPQPKTRGRWPATVVIVASAVLVLGGLFTPVLPSVFGMQISLAAAAVIALLGAWWSRPGRPISGRATARWVRNRWLRVPALALSLGLAAYIGLAFGAVGLVAALVGRPTSRTLTVTGTAPANPWQCAHVEVREAPALLSRALCAPQDVLDQADASQSLTVTGKGFALGMVVQTWQLGPPA
jgi:hypothetical protein